MSVPIHVLSSLRCRISRHAFFTRISRARVLFVGASVGVVLVSAACDRARSASTTDSTASVRTITPPDSIATIVAGSGWIVDAGPLMVLPTVDGGLTAGSLLRPEATELTVGDTIGVGRSAGDGRLELFSRGGLVGVARLTVAAAPRMDEGCTAWPVARLANTASGPIRPWTAAFVAGHVVSIPLDSIEGLSARDSVRLAADLTRLASALRDDTSATFHGLPFVVLRANRARGLDTAFIVATLARHVNQEDSPREERLVIVVDVVGDDAKNWTVAWHERAAGREDDLVVAEPLMAFRTTRSKNVHLLFGRDDGVALGAAVLTRDARGWHVLWESAVAGCN